MTSERYSWLQRRDLVVRYCNRRYLSAEWRLDWHHADKWFQLLGAAKRKYNAASLNGWLPTTLARRERRLLRLLLVKSGVGPLGYPSGALTPAV
jgi:hypothetical protein